MEESDSIRDVWKDNLEEEMGRISELVERYPYAAMDTEFPGVIAKPVGTFSTQASYNYQQVRCNVGILNLIQLGISLCNEHGEHPVPTSTWQFNFYFDTDADMFAQESMHLLLEAGINFERHKRDGICPVTFADFFITSGFIMDPRIRWISFHSSYDFGYLVRLITGADLPMGISEFSDSLRSLFPQFYDIKYLMLFTKALKGGLQDVADELEVPRKGVQHQAGSDSLLTLNVFFRIKQMVFQDILEDSKYRCKLFGLEAFNP